MLKNQKMTGYTSIDNPHNIGSSFLKKHPLIPNTNIFTIFKLLSVACLDKPAIDCIDLRATYRSVLNDSVTISLALKRLGVKKGDIVSVCMPNFYQSIITFFACNRIGAVVTFLDFSASQEEICSYLNLFKSPIFINYDKDNSYNKKIIEETSIRYIITLSKKCVNSISLNGDYNITGDDRIIDFNCLGSIAKKQKTKFEQLHAAKENALILFTSGSTGKPKSVVLTNENVLASIIYAKNTSQKEDVTGTKTLVSVPFSYPYGFVTSALTTLLWGKEAILAPDIGKDTICYYYSKRPNIIFGSPALLDLTINNIPYEQDLSFVSYFISGGDFLTPQHAKRGTLFFEKHGAKVEIGNGSGNAETVSCGTTPVGVPLRPETAGKILVGTRVMVVDSDTLEEKKYGEEGVLCVSGKHVFKEYYNNAELTNQSKFTRNGVEYYKTGTLGYVDKRGYFTLTGRQSRFYIMSSLNKVYCDNVQNIISTYDCVKACAVVKVADEELLYVNKAYIVLNDGYRESDEMIEQINRLFNSPSKTLDGRTVQLKTYEIPTYMEFVDSLPRKMGTEKVDYLFLEEDAMRKVEQCKIPLV